MAIRNLCFLIVCMWCSGPVIAQQANQKPDIPRSYWDREIGGYGVTEEGFKANHLSRLTSKELKGTLSASYLEGFSSGMELGKPDCGVQGKNIDRSTVKLYVDTPGTTDVEILSAVRTGLRSFADVRIVYSEAEAEADASIHLLGYQDRAGDRTIGYTLAYYASKSCKVGTGDKSSTLDVVISFDLETSGAIDTLSRSVVADIDSRVNELIRSMNAQALKTASPK
jgi:hypothetical protein